MSFDMMSYGNKKYSIDSKNIINISNDKMKRILSSNLITPQKNLNWYDKFARFGCIDPLTSNSDNREILFFTKPDIYLFDASSYNMISDLKDIPFFSEADLRYKNALKQLQYSIPGSDGINPFMNILSNAVTSKLDLPSISADNNETSSNIYGTSISYRSHSLKSDNGYDFTLSFNDTVYLEIYNMVKAYDEYTRLLKLGRVAPMEKYILNKILSDQFSIYKFLLANDGETILYYAKLTGVYFTDVPRSDFGDAPQDGFKFSLSFHSQFVEDLNPLILSDFNQVTPGSTDAGSFVPIYYSDIGAVNNDWVKYPVIIKSISTRRKSNNLGHDYKLKWTNKKKKG